MRGAIRDAPGYCEIEAVMEIVGGKWKMAILNRLLAGPRRFGQLRQDLPTVTQRMLTRQLRELEADGLVRRTVYPEVPPKVEYDLTEIGSSLRHIAAELESWGRWYREQPIGDREAEPGAPARPAGTDLVAGTGRD